MIDAAYVQTMARYNRWQNRSLYAAAEGIGDAERRRDRGAFFGSIHATLNHLLWADMIWMSRWSDVPAPSPVFSSPRFMAMDCSSTNWPCIAISSASATVARWSRRRSRAPAAPDLPLSL